MLRSKFLGLLCLLAIGGAGALYGFTNSKATAEGGACGCCVADLCSCAPCVCSCEGPCPANCEDCADCCEDCAGCTAAAVTAAAKPAAACESGCCTEVVK